MALLRLLEGPAAAGAVMALSFIMMIAIVLGLM
jgi:hypothetical protein